MGLQSKGKERKIFFEGFIGINVKIVIDRGWGFSRLVDSIDLWSSFGDYKEYQGTNSTLFIKKSDGIYLVIRVSNQRSVHNGDCNDFCFVLVALWFSRFSLWSARLFYEILSWNKFGYYGVFSLCQKLQYG